MKIAVLRKWLTDKTTISEISVNGKFLCYGLEDKVREVEGRPVEEWKIYGKTAIPYGIYALEITMSSRWKKLMLEIMAVPGYKGVRAHSGNDQFDTDGCLLTGDSYNPEIPDWIGNSKSALVKLFGTVQAALHRGEDVTIEFKKG